MTQGHTQASTYMTWHAHMPISTNEYTHQTENLKNKGLSQTTAENLN